MECKVKRVETADQQRIGINRNIVECKGTYKLRPVMVTVRINRNIVECKVFLCHASADWGKCINRNIVECKVRCRLYNATGLQY